MDIRFFDEIFVEWLDKNVFAGDRHDKHSHSMIASYAVKELNTDAVTEEDVANGLHDVRVKKNFDLARYPFT